MTSKGVVALFFNLSLGVGKSDVSTGLTDGRADTGDPMYSTQHETGHVTLKLAMDSWQR